MDEDTLVSNEMEKASSIKATSTFQRYAIITNPVIKHAIYNESLPTVGGSGTPFLKSLK